MNATHIGLSVLGEEYADCRRQNLHPYIEDGRLEPDIKIQVGPNKFVYGFTRQTARKFAATLKKERKKRELLRQNRNGHRSARA